MKYQVPASILFLVLCYWSCPLTVSGFTEQQLERVTRYVERTFGISGQYAYVIKFTRDQCTELTNTDIAAALKNENVDAVQDAVNNQEIYKGARMVMASNRDLGNDRKEHSEYRLLYPSWESNISPAQYLLNRGPAAGCVVFYTYNSPCNAYCTKSREQFDIAERLSVFETNDKAFVFGRAYPVKSNCCHETRLLAVDEEMPLYHCANNCRKCFNNKSFDVGCLNN